MSTRLDNELGNINFIIKCIQFTKKKTNKSILNFPSRNSLKKHLKLYKLGYLIGKKYIYVFNLSTYSCLSSGFDNQIWYIK